MSTGAIQYGFYNDSASPTTTAISKRQDCELQRSWLETERASFFPLWRDCNDFILPRRARFFVTDVNKGDRRSQRIIDGTATLAIRTLSSGMMSGITSPARPWFQLGVDQATEATDAKEWLYEVREILLQIFAKSNLYDTLPILYSDLGVFGTGAFMVLEDDEDVIRCYDFPIGSYAVGNDEKLRVRTFSRLFRMTVQQVVQRWGNIEKSTGQPDFLRGDKTTNLSVTVQNLWTKGSRQAWIDIVHFIQPNLSYDGTKIESKYKKFESVYYEYGVSGNQVSDPKTLGLLEHVGFDEFPVLCARWEKNSEDVYGTNSPGITALGDIKQLQSVEKKRAQALEKMLNPPLTGPASLRGSAVSLLPGGITYNDVSQGQLGLRPIHEINWAAAITPITEWQGETRQRINDAFFVNLILMMTESDRREITAREIDERHEEKLLAIGPVLSRLNVDVYDQLIARTFNIAMRRGMIPPAPPSLQGQSLQINYISIMHQAQQQIELGGIERFAGFAGQYAQLDPSVMDMIDGDEMLTRYGDASGIEPKILRSPEAVAQIRQQRQQAQQAAQAAENAPKVAGAAKDLSQAQTGDGQNVLQLLLQKQNARKTLGATASPPASVM